MARYIDADKIYYSNEYGLGLVALKQDVDDMSTEDVISIPDNATNGDMIKAMFPNLIITIFSEATPIPYVMVIGENYEFNLTFPLNWWNVPYKKGE